MKIQKKLSEEYSYERGKQHVLAMLCDYFPGLLDSEEPVEAAHLVEFLREVIRLEAGR